MLRKFVASNIGLVGHAALFQETVVVGGAFIEAVAHDYVVDYPDSYDFTCLGKRIGDINVAFGGADMPAGVVVAQYYG